jgi:hypothetical protein
MGQRVLERTPTRSREAADDEGVVVSTPSPIMLTMLLA